MASENPSPGDAKPRRGKAARLSTTAPNPTHTPPATPMEGVAPSAVTAASLAEILGLSRSTVSIVLRGDAERRKISPATVERVLAAARKHNYVPNLIAQSLRRQRSGVVAVIV